ncbi:MAG: hypothetical protein E6I88_04370 [Chloroflexi bacterium]|nr:MAG: hypothetical protein E6I88_04370 [Chloroflexota bacterium]TME45236.1 MAG: hypothetical protein E6I56_09890 [Chloroflexota bacterium]
MSRWWPWDVLIVLGAYHGLNPGMGWLFAVARGLQERRRSAVWQSFLPIALGHEAAIGVVIVLVAVAQFLFAPQALRIAGAVILFAFAGYRLWRRTAHPRGFGMRIGVRGLFGWSFLMSSAHGAGLMLVPIMLRLSSSGGGNQDMALIAYTTAFSPWQGVAAATLHTAALLVVMALVAIVVYERLGIAFLRRAWLNVDLIWTVTLLLAGVITLFS